MTDHGWEALVEVTNANPSEERGMLNQALAQIKAKCEGLDSEEIGMVIRARAETYRTVWPTMALTPTALAKHWDRVTVEQERKVVYDGEEEKKRKKGTNLHAKSDCVTCGGDHFVTVNYRQPKPSIWGTEHGIKHKQHPNDRGYEETAPCPVCNTNSPVMRNFWDGRSWEFGSEPGEVRIHG